MDAYIFYYFMATRGHSAMEEKMVGQVFSVRVDGEGCGKARP